MPGRRHIPRILRPTRSVGRLAVCGWLVLVVTSTGCNGIRGFARRDPGPFGARTPCVLTTQATAEEVVAHVNHNVAKIESWRASSVKIRARLQGMPIPLSGTIVAARDHKLRLEVTSALGKEVDLGSNDELFWIWTKPRGRQPPAVYFASHDQMDIARQNLPLPFEPEWLMEALAVAPLSADDVTIERQADMANLRLVSQHQMPDGQIVKKVIVVHPCHGYVMEHSTFDGQGQTMVRTLLQDYRLDPESGAVLPHHIKLDWPQAEMSMAMDLGHVEVNPPTIPGAVWAMVQVPGTPMVNLGDPRLGGHQYAARPDPQTNPQQNTNARSQSSGETRLALSRDDLDPGLYQPEHGPSGNATVQPFPADEPEFQQPRIQWQEESPAFMPPEIQQEPGRASVDLLPSLEPF